MILSEFKEHCEPLSYDRYDKFFPEINSAYVGYIGGMESFSRILSELVLSDGIQAIDDFLSTCQNNANSFPHHDGDKYYAYLYPIDCTFIDIDFCIKGKNQYNNELAAFLESEWLYDNVCTSNIEMNISTKERSI